MGNLLGAFDKRSENSTDKACLENLSGIHIYIEIGKHFFLLKLLLLLAY